MNSKLVSIIVGMAVGVATGTALVMLFVPSDWQQVCQGFAIFVGVFVGALAGNFVRGFLARK